MKEKIALIFILTLIGCATLPECFHGAPSPDPKKYLLCYELPEASRFSLTSTTVVHNKRVVMGNALADSSCDIVQYGFTVESSGDEGLELEVVYQDRRHQLYDSPTQGSFDFSDLFGKKVSVHLSPVGEITDLVGFGDLPEFNFPGGGVSLGKERYENEIIQYFPHFPAKKIQSGDSWSYTQEYKEPMQGGTLSVKIHYTYTLGEEVKKEGLDCLKLDGKYTISIEGKGGSKGVDLDLKLNGEGTEIVYFAWKKGMLVLIEGKATISGTAENTDLGFAMTIDQTLANTIDIQLEGR